MNAELPTLYAGMPASESNELHAAAARIRGHLKRSVEDLIAAGQELLAVKNRISHGGWLEWLQHELTMSRRTADNLMAIAKKFSKVASLTTLEITQEALYLLAAPTLNPAVSDEALARAQGGEPIGKKEVDEIKARLKQANDRVAGLRTDNQLLAQQNATKTESERRLRDEIEHLAMRVSELQDLAAAPVAIDVNKYRACIGVIWSLMSPQDRAWFLAAIRTGELAA